MSDDQPKSKREKQTIKAGDMGPIPDGLIVQPSKYGKGFNPDKPEHRLILDIKDGPINKPLPIFSHRALLGAPLRVAQESSLEGLIEKIWNQGQTSSCVGWAFAQNIFLRLKFLGTPIEMPSPVDIYTTARALERVANGQTAETALQDVGSSPWLAAQGIAEWGVGSMSVWPFDESKINAEPDFFQLEVAAAFMLQGYVPFESSGKQLCADIDQALAEGFPVVTCSQVDAAFEDYDGKGVLGAPDPARLMGGHAMNCVAKLRDGKRRILNQWDKSWGDNGLATVDDSFFDNPNFMAAFVLPVHATGGVASYLPKEESK